MTKAIHKQKYDQFLNSIVCFRCEYGNNANKTNGRKFYCPILPTKGKVTKIREKCPYFKETTNICSVCGLVSSQDPLGICNRCRYTLRKDYDKKYREQWKQLVKPIIPDLEDWNILEDI